MAASSGGGKRGPSVLVTDSRERPQAPRIPSRPIASPTNSVVRRTPTRLISVDNVLQHASEIPSGQARGPPSRRPLATGPRRNSIVGSSFGSRLAPQNIPGRSTKVSEKLVLIPETAEEKESDEEEDGRAGFRYLEDGENGNRPLKDEELDELKTKGGLKGKSYAERLPKAKRADKLARVTAYYMAQGYKLKATASFAREKHGAKTKLYDDCLYTAYHLPLLPGTEGYRIRSSPILKSPGGKAVLDEEIERSERRNYHEGYFEDTNTYGVRGGEDSPRNERDESRIIGSEIERRGRKEFEVLMQRKRLDSPNRIAPDATTFGEMFIFSYGVVVFWNFTERQEKDILADLTFSELNTGISLMSRPEDESDFETEEFHFEYSPMIGRPRIFNDMITIRSGDHMIKLAMSHAIAQSTKLISFEEKMSKIMHDAQYIPKRLALTGKLGMSRKEIVKILGRLFKSRVDVNLSSNILDVPNFFWDSEPTLHPLYFAIREYLEIAPRIKVLNERCRVFLDLAEILSDQIADTKMSKITWIIIVLIVVSICVTVSEVVIRFTLLEKKSKGGLVGSGEGIKVWMIASGAVTNLTKIRQDLSREEVKALCGMEVVGQTFAEI